IIGHWRETGPKDWCGFGLAIMANTSDCSKDDPQVPTLLPARLFSNRGLADKHLAGQWGVNQRTSAKSSGRSHLILSKLPGIVNMPAGQGGPAGVHLFQRLDYRHQDAHLPASHRISAPSAARNLFRISGGESISHHRKTVHTHRTFDSQYARARLNDPRSAHFDQDRDRWGDQKGPDQHHEGVHDGKRSLGSGIAAKTCTDPFTAL